MILDMHCQQPWFDLIKDGTKKIEGRRCCPAYNQLQSGDIIRFCCRRDKFYAEVVNVIKYKTLEQYLREEGIQNVVPGVTSFYEAIDIYLKFSTRKQIERSGGFLAIHINKIDE
jgi:ASC-1-like (ASCH) protein